MRPVIDSCHSTPTNPASQGITCQRARCYVPDQGIPHNEDILLFKGLDHADDLYVDAPVLFSITSPDRDTRNLPARSGLPRP